MKVDPTKKVFFAQTQTTLLKVSPQCIRHYISNPQAVDLLFVDLLIANMEGGDLESASHLPNLDDPRGSFLVTSRGFESWLPSLLNNDMEIHTQNDLHYFLDPQPLLPQSRHIYILTFERTNYKHIEQFLQILPFGDTRGYIPTGDKDGDNETGGRRRLHES